MFENTVHRQSIIYIIILSVILKFTICATLYHAGSQFALPDTWHYVDVAMDVVNKHIFWRNETLWLWKRTPLYPLFLAGVFSLFGKKFIAVVCIQIILSTFLIVNAYRIAKILGNERIGLMAAALVSIDYLIITYSSFVMTDLLYAALISYLFLYICQFFGSQQRLLLIFKLGAIFAVATLLRPIGYYLLPLLGIMLFIYGVRTVSVKTALGYLMVLILPSMLLVGGWQVRNKFIYGSYQYTAIDAYNFYHYYAADIVAHKQQVSIKDAQQQLEKKAESHYATATQKYTYYRNQGLKIILSNPLLAVIQGAKGFFNTLFGNDYMLFFYNHDQFKHGKLLESELFHFQLNKFNIYDWMKLSVIGFLFIFNFTLVLFAGFYFYTEFKSASQHKVVIWMLLVIIGYFLLVSSNYCSQARFRLPFQVLLDCTAVLGASKIMSRYGYGFKYEASRI